MSRESKSKKLNFKQQIVYDYIRSYISERGYAPSVREICVETGIQSTSGVFHYLNQLEHLGFIRRDPDKPRSIIVLKPCLMMPSELTVYSPRSEMYLISR